MEMALAKLQLIEGEEGLISARPERRKQGAAAINPGKNWCSLSYVARGTGIKKWKC